jgi:ribosomal protein L10
MARRAKIFARVFDYNATPQMPDGQMVFTVEWKRLAGTRVGGKVKITVSDITSSEQLTADLRESLAAQLSAKFAPEVIQPKDIVGYSA